MEPSIMRFLIVLVVTLALGVQGSPVQDNKPEKLDRLYRKEHLTDKYVIEWTVDFPENMIDFVATVKTKGFVGLGISYTGGMPGSDIVIGGVQPNGEVYFSDRYAMGLMVPIEDESQDWNLVSATENATHTVLHMRRKLDTCDDRDIAINEDTLKIIWAYSDKESDDITYHGGINRGSLAVNFLDPAVEDPDLSPYSTWRVAQDLALPARDTTYWCTFFKGPQLTKKHHVVGFHIFMNGSASMQHTHHADLYKCTAPNGQNANDYFGKYAGNNGYDCYYTPDYFPLEHCQLFEFQWSIGGKVTMFPEYVGVPIGEHEDEWYMTEIHYDNPRSLAGLKVHSGMELYYTDKLRDIDAGFLQIGVPVSKSYSLTIPPNVAEFTLGSHCPSECLAQLPKEGVNIFVYLLHSHLSGRKQRVRHFRGEEELPWIAHDEHFDFNYQNNRVLREQIKLLPGDQLALECVYETKWKHGKVTLGGRSARDEMCQSFLMYYPRVEPVNQCGSYFPQEEMLAFMGIQNVTLARGEIDPVITLPAELAGKRYSSVVEALFLKNPEKTEEFQNLIRYGEQQTYCYPHHTESNKDDLYVKARYPNIREQYRPVSTCNLRGGHFGEDSPTFGLLLTGIGILIIVSMLIVSMLLYCNFSGRRYRLFATS